MKLLQGVVKFHTGGEAAAHACRQVRDRRLQAPPSRSESGTDGKVRMKEAMQKA